jgi:hypothetical protein
MALAGHVSLTTWERNSRIRMEANRQALHTLSRTEFAPGMVQNWAQFIIWEKSEEANL